LHIVLLMYVSFLAVFALIAEDKYSLTGLNFNRSIISFGALALFSTEYILLTIGHHVRLEQHSKREPDISLAYAHDLMDNLVCWDYTTCLAVGWTIGTAVITAVVITDFEIDLIPFQWVSGRFKNFCKLLTDWIDTMYSGYFCLLSYASKASSEGSKFCFTSYDAFTSNIHF
jgi:hypothetical protein